MGREIDLLTYEETKINADGIESELNEIAGELLEIRYMVSSLCSSQERIATALEKLVTAAREFYKLELEKNRD